ncbi:MAG: hypothetical protein GF401_06080 [Chitinivibrionales bacterium]|nr:hypothetical protein [Chitinivibrionales bacterium]
MKSNVACGALVLLLLHSSCLWYFTHERRDVIIGGIDIDQTLKVARSEMEKGGWGCVLPLWAVRDQFFGSDQAQKVSDLYFDYIDSLKEDFNVWHLTWAISNINRLGNDSVQQVMQKAWDDASERASTVHRIADRHVNGDKIYMGGAHIGGRRAELRFLVVPGKDRYLDSYEEYLKRQKDG